MSATAQPASASNRTSSSAGTWCPAASSRRCSPRRARRAIPVPTIPSPLRIAVVGCGGRSRSSHLPLLTEFADAQVVALCDPVPAVRDAAGEKFRVERRYAHVEELLDAEPLDAVFIATPPHLNAAAALPFLERGIHTLLEKP